MSWKILLKRRIETLADYTNASPEERYKYHSRKATSYGKRLQALRNSIANVGETNPNISLEEDMRELQKIRNFHTRQRDRIKMGSSIPDVFLPELEQQRKKQKLITTPRGVLNPYTDLSMEEYESLSIKQKVNYHMARYRATTGEEKEFHNMTREEKRKFHAKMENRFKRTGDLELKRFHSRMHGRLDKNLSLPTFYSPEHEEEE